MKQEEEEKWWGKNSKEEEEEMDGADEAMKKEAEVKISQDPIYCQIGVHMEFALVQCEYELDEWGGARMKE